MKSKFALIRFQLGLIVALLISIAALEYKTPNTIRTLGLRGEVPEEIKVVEMEQPVVIERTAKAKLSTAEPTPRPEPAPSPEPAPDPTPEPTPDASPGEDPDPDPREVGQEPEEGEPMPLFSLSRMPIFPGCEEESGEDARFECFKQQVMRAVAAEVKYPKMMREMGIQGTVFLELVINKKGVVTQVTVLRAPHDELGQEAQRAVFALNGIGPMQPGMQGLQPVACKFQMPVQFKLGH